MQHIPLKECLSSFVYPQINDHKFPTFIVLSNTGEDARKIGDALLHQLTWPGIIQYNDMHTPDVLSDLLPMGKCKKQLLNVPKLLYFHNYSPSNQDNVAILFQLSNRYMITPIIHTRPDTDFPVKMRIDTDYLLLYGDVPISQRRHIFDHFVLQVFMTFEEFMQYMDECCVHGSFLWFCCGKSTWYCVRL